MKSLSMVLRKGERVQSVFVFLMAMGALVSRLFIRKTEIPEHSSEPKTNPGLPGRLAVVTGPVSVANEGRHCLEFFAGGSGGRFLAQERAPRTNPREVSRTALGRCFPAALRERRFVERGRYRDN